MKVKSYVVLVLSVFLIASTIQAADPVLDPIGTRIAFENTLWQLPVVATDTDGDALTFTIDLSSLPGDPYYIDAGNGFANIYWQSTFDDSGTYSITVTVSDGNTIDFETFDLNVKHVNRAPSMDFLADQSGPHAVPLIFNVSGTDPDGDSLTFSWIPDFYSDILNLDSAWLESLNLGDSVNIDSARVLFQKPSMEDATLTNNGNGTATFSWLTADTVFEDYFVTFIVTDSLINDTVDIMISILGHPVIDSIGNKQVEEGSNLNFSVISSDPDLDIPVLSWDAHAYLLANATFTLNGDGTGTFDLNPTVADLGNYWATFIAIDTASAVPDTVIQTINIEVFEVNIPPVLSAIGDHAGTQGYEIVINLSATDANSHPLTFTADPMPFDAVIVNNGNGTATFSWTPGVTKAFYEQMVTFTVADNAGGSDSEEIKFTITLNPQQPPVLDPIGPRGTEAGATLNFTVTASDPNGTIPELSAGNLPATASFNDNLDGTGDFSWTPGVGDIGAHEVTFVAYDGIDSDAEVVTIVVSAVGNQSPVLIVVASHQIAEGELLAFPVSATDVDGPSLTLLSSGLPPGATFSNFGGGSGQFSWTPSFTQSGIYTFMISATDGVATVEQEITITVDDAGNKSPVISAADSYSSPEETQLSFTVSAVDPEGSNISFSSSLLPLGASFVDNGNDSATFSWIPTYCQGGEDTLIFTASDGGASARDTILLNITEAGDQLPELNFIADAVGTEGQLLEFDISSQDFDGCERPVLRTIFMPPTASFNDNLNSTGTFSWTPGFTQGGSTGDSVVYFVTFYADHPILDVDSQVVKITIHDAGNQAPNFTYDDTTSFTEFAGFDFVINISAADGDSTVPTFEVAVPPDSLPDGATFVDNGDGTGAFTWTPAPDQSGTHNVTIIARDAVDTSLTAELDFTFEIKGGRGKIKYLGADGLIAGTTDEFGTCELVTLYFGVENNTGESIVEFNAGFNVEIPSGGQGWGTVNGASWGTLDPFFLTPLATNLVDVDGLGVDTIGFNGFNLFFGGIPDGFDDTAFTITIGPLSSLDDGKEICIDSSYFISPGWLWRSGSNNYIPEWDGPYCFTITTVGGNQASSFTSTLNDTTIEECENLVLTMTGTDPDGIDPYFTVSPKLEGMSIASSGGTGTFTWSPNGLQEGTYELTFSATDGCAADVQTITITVTPEAAPVLTPIPVQTAQVASEMLLLVTTSDPGGVGAPTMRATTAPITEFPPLETSLPAGAAMSDTSGVGYFTWTPVIGQLNQSFEVFFWVTDSDCGSTDSQTVTFNVIADDPPIIMTSDTIITISECETLDLVIKSVDPQTSNVTMNAPSFLDPSALWILQDKIGDTTVKIWSWTPASGFSGSYDVVFKGTDQSLSSTEHTVTITVTRDEEPTLELTATIPGKNVINSGDTTYYEKGDTVLVTLLATDPEGQPLYLELVDSLPPGAQMGDNGGGIGVFTFYSENNIKGIYTLNFRASDYCAEIIKTLVLKDTVLISTDVGPGKDLGLPQVFALSQNYPNPFNPSTIIQLDIPVVSHVRLDLFNVLGQQIKNLVDRQMSPATYQIEWDGRDEMGSMVASGIYFYRVEAGEFRQTRKMVLMK